MAKIVNYYKTLRRNWKKSTVATFALAYGISSLKNRYDINVFMESQCREAEKYGNEQLPTTSTPRSITVILNPAANKKSAKEDYEKYCEPLLHLAGICVNVVQTNSVGHAKELVATLPEGEPVIVAGGDGTLSETVTGILRLTTNNNKRVVGILPVGRINNVGNELFPLGNSLPKVKQLADATMAIIKNNYELKDVMKIEVKSDESENSKPVFALGGLEWGAFRDANARRDKYWIYGGLRDYATYIFNGYKSSLSWDCKGIIKLTPPCGGCNNCQTLAFKQKKSFRMLDLIMPKTKEDQEMDLSNVSNEQCGTTLEKQFKAISVDLSLIRSNGTDPSHLLLNFGKPKIGYFEFISDGWKRIRSKVTPSGDDVLKARTVEILPDSPSKEGTEVWYEIDNEEFDVKPVKISVLPNAINIFCSHQKPANNL